VSAPCPPRASRDAFTLIELMIVIAIVGILAATAIPNFIRFQLHSKVAEARVNMKAVVTAEHSFYASNGAYRAAAVTPAGVATGTKRLWAGGGFADFQSMGWAPAGSVFFSYEVTVDPTGTGFTVAAQGDVDSDGGFAEFAYMHPIAGTTSTVPATIATTCSPAGVWDRSSGGNALDTLGPCTPLDGVSAF